jgi:hypothetical protein
MLLDGVTHHREVSMKTILSLSCLLILAAPLRAADPHATLPAASDTCNGKPMPALTGGPQIDANRLDAYWKNACIVFLNAANECNKTDCDTGTKNCTGNPAPTCSCTKCWDKFVSAYEAGAAHPDKVKDDSIVKKTQDTIDAASQNGNHFAGKGDVNTGSGQGQGAPVQQSSSTSSQFTPTLKPVGPPDVTAAPAKDDPNKYNNMLVGAQYGILGGLLGFILLGPAGVLLAAAVGFGMGYYINKLNPR